jgi:hypothetical protein
VLLSIVIIYNLVGFVSTLTLCIPIQAYWDFTITKKTCHASIEGMWALVILHIVTDFLIFAIPIPAVVKMRLPLRQKMGVLMIFALGFL